MNKIRVAVFYGGRSGEHEVSLQSAASVVQNLDRERFDIVPIGIDKQGHWLLNDVDQLILESPAKSLSIQTSKTKALAKGELANGSGKLFDVVFPVMHGSFGEDGATQGLLELMDMAYVGAGVLGSALAMDKDTSKRLVAAAGLPIVPYLTIKHGAWQNQQAFYQNKVTQELGYPVFVKPANTGSSVGVHKVKTAAELIAAVEDAFLYDTKILIEQGVNAREIELSVLENPNYGEAALVSVPGEIVPQHEFYSYAAKYLDASGADLLIPAPLSAEQVKQAQAMASQIFEILECEGMARVDLFLDKNTNQFVFNEINTIPGFTQISMYPKLWEASGLSYQKLLSCLVDLALARHERKQGLKREWAIVNE